MNTNRRCQCGNTSICYEVKRLSKNRGRWYWKCANDACNYFAWDNSALPFIAHPYEAFNTKTQFQLEHAKRRRFAINSRKRNARQENAAIQKTVVTFTIINKDQIAIRLSGNSATIDTAIASLPNIIYDPVSSHYIIPANLTAYTHAYRSIPTDINNLEVIIDPIMPTVLETLRLTATEAELDDSQARYAKFVESNFNGLRMETDREAVKRGLEFNGRILLSNQTGLNGILVAFSLIKLYEEEFPVLLICPKAMCLTWRARVMEYFGYSKKQVVVGDRKYLKKESDRATKRLKLSEDANVDDNDSDYNENEEEEEEEEEEKLKFLIVDVEMAYQFDIHLLDIGFKIAVMDNSDSFRFRMHSRVGRIAKMIKSHKRVILLSEMSYRSLPIELFVQINALQPNLFPNFDTYSKRYCDAKQEIFGWKFDGRSNHGEFKYVLDKVIWHAPDIHETKLDLSAVYRHKILCHILVKDKDAFAENVEKLMMDDYFEDDEDDLKQEIIANLDENTGKSKIEFTKSYIKYIFESFWTQNIVILYRHKKMLEEIEKLFNTRTAKVEYMVIDKQEDIQSKMKLFMAQKTVRVVLVNMNLENLKMIHAVDLVVFAELPLTKQHVERIESVFKIERQWPITLRYLMAPGSLDDYLWKNNFESLSTL
ncbi:hypothetical protein K501DRAFT_336921 [Backusella circina FSU 941]|nr:hypothetical protein K501DRAFT_336921 [Backusella circina FSU 941]